jgi:tight adherence protein C
MGYAIAVFVICFILIASGLALVFYREMLRQRLSAVIGPRAAGTSPRLHQAAESFGLLAGSLRKVIPQGERETSALKHRLVRAGFRSDNAVNVLYGIKAVTPIMLCVIVTVTGLYRFSPFIVFAVTLVIGYLLPDYFLDHRIKSREEDIRRGLPDLLDLLVVCLEAGLSLDQAMVRAVDEMRPSYLAIADEFGLVMLEIRAGRARADAWRSLSDRNDFEAIRTMVSILVQSDQFGTGISRTLRSHAETMRTRRRQDVEERAAKTPIKLLFPLVVLVFPLLLVIIAGPAFMMIYRGFNK